MEIVDLSKYKYGYMYVETKRVQSVQNIFIILCTNFSKRSITTFLEYIMWQIFKLPESNVIMYHYHCLQSTTS